MRLEVRVHAEQPLPLAAAVGAPLLERCEWLRLEDAGGHALDELVNLEQAAIHALAAEWARDVGRIAREPNASTAEATRAAAFEVGDHAPVDSVGFARQPRRPLCKQRAEVFQVGLAAELRRDLKPPARTLPHEWKEGIDEAWME